MDIFTYCKFCLNEWWNKCFNKKKVLTSVKQTLEQETYSNLRTIVKMVKERGFFEVPVKHQLSKKISLATDNAAELLTCIERAYINISTQLPVSRDYPIPKLVTLDDWLVTERSISVPAHVLIENLIYQLDRLDTELERFIHETIWAHYIRKSTVFFEDSILLMEWYLEVSKKIDN